MNKELAVEVSGLVKVYHDGDHPVPVLSDVTFSVARGETVAILGSSGSGKSTLLHAVGGLDTIDSGKVRVAGTSLSASFATARSASSTSFTTSCPSSRRSTTSRCRSGSAGRIRRPRERRPAGCSRPWVSATARNTCPRSSRAASATKPVCILADEPTGNLDKATAQGVFDIFLKLARDEGTAIVIVTHDEGLAARCDRILRLDAGVIREA